MAVRTVEPAGRREYPGVKSVVKVQRETDGTVTRTVVAEERGGRRKTSKRYRRLEKALRKAVKAENVATSEYLRRHDRSRRSKKNGAVRDLGKNVRKAIREGSDTL